MKLISSILLCFFCILTSFLNTCYAADITAKNPEILEPQYLQILISNENSVTVSVVKTFQNITQFLQTKYFSLLNWKQYSRTTNLTIDNYNRTGQFGRWINDTSDNACFNTRAKVLMRDSNESVVFKQNNHCVVEQGSWNDPYTEALFNTAKEVQIDHLVALKNAYLSGAYKWSFKRRCLYANYLGYDFHLLSVSGFENMKKGDSGPEKYMPPNPNYACTYVRNWLAVKMLWGLTMRPQEAQAIRQILIDHNCSLTDFRISDLEVDRQIKYAHDHIELCESFARK